MNNNWEVLMRLIIPAILLVFWAINQIAQKQAEETERVRRMRNAGPARGPREPLPDLRVEPRKPAEEPRSRPAPAANPRAPVGDEIVILSTSENRRGRQQPRKAAESPTPARTGSTAGKKRRAQQPARDPARGNMPPYEPSPAGNLTTPFASIMGPLTGLPDIPAIGTSPLEAAATSSGCMPVARFRVADLNSQHWRDALALNEILAPPLALRGRQRPRG